MSRYDFYRPGVPSFSDMRPRLEADKDLTFDRVDSTVDGIDGLVLAGKKYCHRFLELDPDRIPFSIQVVDGLCSRIAETCGGKLPPEVAEMGHACRFAVDRYNLRRPPAWITLTPEMQRLAGLVQDSYLGRQQQRLFLFGSGRGLCERDIDNDIMPLVLNALNVDPSIQWPDKMLLGIKRSWNKSRTIPGWPAAQLTISKSRQVLGFPWSSYPDWIKRTVEEALQRQPRFVTWDADVCAALARDPDGLAHSVELVRICLGALRRAGVRELRDLRDISIPAHFRLIADTLYQESGREVTRLLRTKLVTLGALAKRSNELSETELDEIEVIMQRYEDAHKKFLKSHPSSNETNLKHFTSDQVIQKLRNLPLKVFDGTEPSRLVTRSVASEIKQPVIVAVRLDTGLSYELIRHLNFERHFSELDGTHAGCLRVVIPAGETSNGVAREGIISAPYAKLVRAFNTFYRPSLDLSGRSPYLFPSIDIAPLRKETISAQQCAFLREKFDHDFSPAMVRLIIKHIILSENPKATGVLATVLGLRDQDYIERLTTPYRDRQDRQDLIGLIASGQLE